ncbi:MAG: sigma-70 family RNA polymerase sigma factor [Alistipes sp.]|jgi:RNA polymerase sigma-70 factor (ECF subfamily)|nr:sigma-70 family RNA polymerase sigma factor [Alistipes sp.]
MKRTTTSTRSALPGNGKIDIGILQKVRRGDEHAFGQLYCRYYKPVFGLMFKTTHSREDAEDIAQEVFVRLWNMRDKIDPEKNIQALIFVIARRAAVDLYRRSGRLTAVFSDRQDDEESLCEGLSPEEILEDVETKLLLEVTIEGMPRSQREVFSLYYHDSLTPAEIAQRLGLSYENVRKQIYNGKRQLRTVMSITLAFLIFQM